MKLAYILLLTASLHISAAVHSQRVNIIQDNASLKTVFNDLHRQTGYFFMYNNQVLKKAGRVSVKAIDKELREVLDEIIRSWQLSYTIRDKVIIVSLREDPPKSFPGKTAATPPGIATDTLKGIVTDTAGASLPGVSIQVKGTDKGTSTDLEGQYVLENLSGDETLVFSFLGYKTRELPLNGRATIHVVLEQDIAGLEEVVVVGYGTQKRATLTGSIVTASGEQLKQSPAVNLSNSLAGRLPGIIANNRSGQPGSGSSILIRGRSTLDDNEPLIVIDGVWGRSGFGQINPNDIESISVLKDASAAIYGAQAANGVILITTKRGTLGKPVINYTFNQGFVQPTRLPELADAASYAEFTNELLNDQGQPDMFTPEEILKFRDGSDPAGYPNSDWIDATLKPYSLQNKQHLSVSGGNEAVKYYVSGNLSNEEGIFKNGNTEFDNFSFRSNLDAQVSPAIKVAVNIGVIQTDRAYSSMETGDIFRAILRNYPFLPVYHPNGLPAAGIERGENPVVMATDEAGYNRQKNNMYQTTASIDVKIPWVQGLSADGFVAYDRSYGFDKRFRTPWSVYDYDSASGEYTERLGGATLQPDLRESTDHSSRTTVNFRIKYDQVFGLHSINTFAAVEQTESSGNDFWAFRKNYLSDAIDQLFAGGASDKDNSGTAWETARRNFFGRINYNFRERYLVDFNFRYDGSQNFPKGKRYGFFPGVSAGWRISEEPFIKDNLSFIDNLKLRASIGKMGNDRIPAFQYLSSYSFSSGYYFGDPAVQLERGITPNPHITWEVATTANIGLESSFWNGLLGMEFDVFKTRRDNILTSRDASVPDYTGLSLPDENIGVVENKGFELQLSHRNHSGSLDYDLQGNVSYAKNTIIDIDEPLNAQPYQMRTGHPVGAELYYRAIGIYRTEEAVENSPHPEGTKVGDLQYEDINKDGIIDSRDRLRLDYTNTPRVSFGFSMGLSYRNFYLNVLIQGQSKARQYLFLQSGLQGNTFQEWIDNRYTPENPDSSFPRLPTYDAEVSGFHSTFWWKDASFVRLKTLEIGYTVPQKILSM